jgi:RNA polymerase sigma-70 factor (ECF subfamily)
VGQILAIRPARRAPDPAPELDDLTRERAARGDREAFRRLVERYQRPVFSLLSRMVRDAALVEDLAQETFVRVFRALPDFGRDGRLNLSAWILTIAARLAIDHLRRRAFDPVPIDRAVRELPGDARTDGDSLRRGLGAAIERAVNALPPEYRAAFLLREVHGLEYEAIAQALQIDLGTVKSRLGRARAALRAALAEIHDE